MAGGINFQYLASQGTLHKSSPVLKLLAYFCLNIALSQSPITILVPVLVAQAALLLLMGLSIRGILKTFRIFIPVFVISAVNGAFFSKGTVILETGWLTLKFSGSGLLESLRFIASMSSAILLTAILLSSTRLKEIQYGVYSVLRIIGRRRAWTVATIMRIMLAAIPALIRAAAEGNASLAARACTAGKHPLRYIRAMSSILLVQVRELSYGYSRALYIRGWSIDGGQPSEASRGQTASTIIILVCSVLLLAAIIAGGQFIH